VFRPKKLPQYSNKIINIIEFVGIIRFEVLLFKGSRTIPKSQFKAFGNHGNEDANLFKLAFGFLDEIY
jgi:hypothetical protein